MTLEYMTEDDVERIVTHLEKEAKNSGINFLETPKKFIDHLVTVGNIAYEVANRQVFTERGVNPHIPKSAGFVHDIGKILGLGNGKGFGPAYHEITGAFLVLKRGEKLGIVGGGTYSERKKALVQIASCLPADWAIPEEIGDNFPETALYPELIGKDNELGKQIRYLEETIGESIINIATPNTLEKAIACYADFKRDGLPFEETIDEIGKRYKDYADEETDPVRKDYWMKISSLRHEPGFRTRILGICGLVESFLK